MLVNRVSRKIITSTAIAISALASNAFVAKAQNNQTDYNYTGLVENCSDYLYRNKNGELTAFKMSVGQEWKTITTDNPLLNGIIDSTNDGDDYISEKDYVMLERFLQIADNYNKSDKILEDAELNKLLKKIKKGKLSKEEIIFVQAPDVFEVDNWSEGLNRKINYIKIPESDDKRITTLKKELEDIGNQVGFKVIETQTPQLWLEDYAIRRFDGHTLFEPENNSYIGEADSYPVDFYRRTIEDYDSYKGKSMLQGGNTLNTLLADGTPAAIVGDWSIWQTIEAYFTEENESNITKAINMIADDLGIKPENITFIPQFDFHIDMFYRPLQNGVVAIPDFETGIEILNNTENIPQQEKEDLLSKLNEVNNLTKKIQNEAKEILENSGYKLVKIPCFSVQSGYGASKINYMNGICGMSANGEKYYITNKSNYSELDEIIKKYFTDAGIDKVFFVSTQPFLNLLGGIDCLTQEM